MIELRNDSLLHEESRISTVEKTIEHEILPTPIEFGVGVSSGSLANSSPSSTNSSSSAIRPDDVFAPPSLPCSLPDYLEQIERELICRALRQARNSRTQAAELLGVSFRQLRYQIQKLKISDQE